jgi:prepilin-type N-terminal cleavage/methylation domain-containing protein
VNRSAGTSGFTLIETLVALAILSGVLIATYAALSNALVVAARVADRSEAVAQLERQVALLQRRTLGAALSIEGETPAYRWRLSARPIPAGSGSVVIPVRITGVIRRKVATRSDEIAFETIVLGRAQ